MEQHEVTKKKYDVALATRNFEIELFWKRSLFFWGFIASAFVGYATLIKDEPNLAVILACFGFVCSVAWSLANRGSKYWQENWEYMVAEIEDEVTGVLFKARSPQQNKGAWLTSRRFSVSKVTIALSDYTCMVWFTFMGYHIYQISPIDGCFSSSVFTFIFIIGSLLFTALMAVSGRSTPENQIHNKAKQEGTP